MQGHICPSPASLKCIDWAVPYPFVWAWYTAFRFPSLPSSCRGVKWCVLLCWFRGCRCFDRKIGRQKCLNSYSYVWGSPELQHLPSWSWYCEQHQASFHGNVHLGPNFFVSLQSYLTLPGLWESLCSPVPLKAVKEGHKAPSAEPIPITEPQTYRATQETALAAFSLSVTSCITLGLFHEMAWMRAVPVCTIWGEDC